ncbi:MAG: nucleotide exchange factor GrpE [Ruminococcus sp.]|nr:nucleotide exchange factor GrpE [Ruminococcus sp.]
MDEKEKNVCSEDEEITEINEITDNTDASSETESEPVSTVAELEEKLDSLNDRYVRLYAEYDNFRKRAAREKSETFSFASSKCIEKLLPVIDSFERSLEVECSDDNFRKGLEMISNQLQKFLTDMNVSAIDALGAEFDPQFHNAVQQLENTDYASGHVCTVFQKGYVLGDKLIRPAMVAVAV